MKVFIFSLVMLVSSGLFAGNKLSSGVYKWSDNDKAIETTIELLHEQEVGLGNSKD